MTRSLPANPDLDRLRREAKALKGACVAASPEALERFEAAFPGGGAATLSRCQTVLAREYGFATWPKLKASVETARAATARRRAKASARAGRAAARASQVESLAERILELARAGDASAMAHEPGVARTVSLKVRDRIASDPEHWRMVIDALIAGLGHSNPKVRFECAHALDTYADVRAREALSPLVDDPVPRVRWMAMHALACDACKVEPPPFSRSLCERIADHALNDPSIRVRRHAAWELAHCAGALARETLGVLLSRETDAGIVRGAREALRRLARVDNQGAPA